MEDGVVCDAIGMIRAGIDALLDSGLASLSSVEVASVVTEVESHRRRLEAVDQQLIAEITTRGIAGEYARSAPADLLVELLRVTPREARARVSRARDMGPRCAVTGEPLDPILPAVAAAQHAGHISGEHATAISRVVAQIPDRYAAEFTAIVEHALVKQSLHVHPGQVLAAGAQLLARIDQDGQAPKDEERQRRRDLAIRNNQPDGMGTITGKLTLTTTAVWNTIIDALSAPQPTADGERDERTPGQRRHDAFEEAGMRLIRSGTLPDSGGVPVTIITHLNADDLAHAAETDPAPTTTTDVDADNGVTAQLDAGCDDGDVDVRGDLATGGPPSPTRGWPLRPNGGSGGGMARTAYGSLISIAELLRLASEAEIIPVILNATGGVLSYGRTRRLATPGQRLALAARDLGCTFPGCSRPPSWCEAHHVIDWLLGGPTDICNLCLLCRYHHRNFEELGWIVYIADDGKPEWLPPPWLDPAQEPRRNTAHHTEIIFDTSNIDLEARST